MGEGNQFAIDSVKSRNRYFQEERKEATLLMIVFLVGRARDPP